MQYLAANYPECSGAIELHTHQDAAHEAAGEGDEEVFLEALRAYMRAGRRVALQMRRDAA